MRDEAYIEANRRAWNETAELHEESQLGRLIESFADPAFTTLDATEQAVLERIGVAGKAVAQLSCNNGRELLSVMRRGAARGVGFDISEAFVAQGRRLAAAASLPAEFVRCSVYDIPARYDGCFDLVYVTVGALGWLPDLDAYFAVVARLLGPGGHLFIYEMHPILDMFDAESGLEVRHSYFRREPYVEAGSPDYYQPEQRIAATSYWFHHKLSDVIGGCLDHGLRLVSFEELDHDVSAVYRAFARLDLKPPLSYTLVARKE